jgi:hypothetical protein
MLNHYSDLSENGYHVFGVTTAMFCQVECLETIRSASIAWTNRWGSESIINNEACCLHHYSRRHHGKPNC